MIPPDLAVRQDLYLRPDPSRVVSRLFVAGQEIVGGSKARTSGVVGRLLALDEAEVHHRLDDLWRRFGSRHCDLRATFAGHAERMSNRLDPEVEISEERRLLLGATFTHEYAVEAAALCNPSIVAHPDQSTAAAGTLRFVMSVRNIGEGHRSSIGFRTGSIAGDGTVTVDDPGPFATVGTVESPVLDRNVFRRRLRTIAKDGDSVAYVLDRLGPTFSVGELDTRLDLLRAQRDTWRNAEGVIADFRSIADCSYRTSFAPDSALSERVLWPATRAESHGVEDARFVRFVDDDGAATYYATYTAFDGVNIAQQLLQTEDFVTFASSPMVGAGATNKGLALFPRRIDGRYAALSRHDRETNAVALSAAIGHWRETVTIQAPKRGWELVQLGNCGSPIETEDGWLVLTHGVGPMRTYSIGALLLDLDDPTVVVATLADPLLSPAPHEQDGYVPNVVYSCGAIRHGDTIVVPYAIADTAIGFASIAWPALRDAMIPGP